MAGSLNWYSYQADSGQTYAVKNDESKAEATFSTGGSALAAVFGGIDTLPRGIRPRYVNAYNQARPAQRTRIKVGTAATYAAIAAGTTIGEAAGDGTTSITWVVTSKRGERTTLPTFTDTGLTDGD